MMFTKLLEAGPDAILSVVIFIIALTVFNWARARRWKLNGATGQERRQPVKVACPVAASDLEPTLKGLVTTLDNHVEVSKDHAKMTNSSFSVAQRIDSGVERLLEQVKPGARVIKVREESRDILMRIESGQGAGQKTAEDLLGRILAAIEENGNGR